MPALAIRDDISSRELRRRARRESDGRVGTRLIAIANVLDGMDRTRAARLAGLDRQTPARLDSPRQRQRHCRLCDRPKPGRTPKLSEGQRAVLTAVVVAGPGPGVDQIGRWRIVDLCRNIAERRAELYPSASKSLKMLKALT